jgi:hypothetical protein
LSRPTRPAAAARSPALGEDDQLDVARRDPERAQLRSGFLLRLDVEFHRKLEIGMPARQTLEAGVGAGVDQHNAVAMFDGEDVSRQPAGPFLVEDRRQAARQTAAAADELARLDPHAAGRDGVNAHVSPPHALRPMRPRCVSPKPVAYLRP